MYNVYVYIHDQRQEFMKSDRSALFWDKILIAFKEKKSD